MEVEALEWWRTAAAVGWLLITIGFDIYSQLTSGANALFRSLGTIIVALYWLYLLIISLLIGGALNATRTGQRQRDPDQRDPDQPASPGDFGTSGHADHHQVRPNLR